MSAENNQWKGKRYPFEFEQETRIEADVSVSHRENISPNKKTLGDIRFCSCRYIIYPDEEFCSRCGRPASMAKTAEEIVEQDRIKKQHRSAMNVVYAPPEIMEQLFHKREGKEKK